MTWEPGEERRGDSCKPIAQTEYCSTVHPSVPPRSRPCSLEEQYFKCGIFWDYDAPQRRVSNSEAPVLAGGIPVFLRGSQFSGASELKEGAGEQIKVHQHSKAPIVLFLQLYN